MTEKPSSNIYQNTTIGAIVNPVMPEPDAADEAFAQAANEVLSVSVGLIRALIGAHQGAAAIVVQEDWATIRKSFSLSEKYTAWADYKTPATGYGIHGWLLQQEGCIRLTQAELENHPEWRGFGDEVGKHPPMRGWMAVPIRDETGVNWGLLQLSDKYEGEFTDEDEIHFADFARLVSRHLAALWEVRNLQKSALSSVGT